jgi:hypothetical protein
MRWFKPQQAYTALERPDIHSPDQYNYTDVEESVSAHNHQQKDLRYPPLAQCVSILLNFVLLCTTALLYLEVHRLHSPLPPWPSNVYCKHVPFAPVIEDRVKSGACC